MPDTGEKREISRFVNAKEAKTVQDSKKALSKTERQTRNAVQQSRSRKGRSVPPRAKMPGKTAESRLDREAADRMADEGDPNPKP